MYTLAISHVSFFFVVECVGKLSNRWLGLVRTRDTRVLIGRFTRRILHNPTLSIRRGELNWNAQFEHRSNDRQFRFRFSVPNSISVSRFPFPFIRFASDPLSRSNVTSLCRASSTTGSSSPNSPSLRAFHTKYRNMNLVAACAQHGSNYAYAITVIWLTLA